MKFSDNFIQDYQTFLIHKNETGENVIGLKPQVNDFKNAVEYANLVFSNKSIKDFNPQELVDIMVNIHKLATPNLYKTLPQGKEPEFPGKFRHDLSLDLKHYPQAKNYYQTPTTDSIWGMARFLREHHGSNKSDIGLDFLSAYYKLLWAQEYDEQNRNIFKRRVTMDFLTKNMNDSEKRNFQLKYSVLAKQLNPPQEWSDAYLKISTQLDSPLTPAEKLALDKIFWIRDDKNLPERTLSFAAELIEAVKQEQDPIEIFARFAYRFIQIHPFYNGNSRAMHIFLNVILMEANLPPIFLGNIFSSREALYQPYFHQPNEETVLPSFIEVLRKTIELDQKTHALAQFKEIEWKSFPPENLKGSKYEGHHVRFFTFNDPKEENPQQLVAALRAEQFAVEMKKAKDKPSIVVDLTSSPIFAIKRCQNKEQLNSSSEVDRGEDLQSALII